MVAKDVDVLPEARGTVLEAEAEEVADIRGRTTAEFNGKSRAVVGWRRGSASLHDTTGSSVTYECRRAQGAFGRHQFEQRET